MCHVANVKCLSRQFYRATPVQSSCPPVQICLQLLDNLPNPLPAILSPSIGNLHLGHCPFDTPFYPQRSPPYLNSVILPRGFNFVPEKSWLRNGYFCRVIHRPRASLTRTLPCNNKQTSAKVNPPMVPFTVYIISLRGRLLVAVIYTISSQFIRISNEFDHPSKNRQNRAAWILP